METDKYPYRLEEGIVDINDEHIKIYYCNTNKDSINNSIHTALISHPKEFIFNVQFLTKNKKALKFVKKELDFYLIEKNEVNPWLYAIYHCGTSSNLYSNVRWNYYRKG